ncbi:MAG: hypothetical protein JNL50_00300 [Phycisphaerae bacterium]|nr:hypothetical protein [Phycisphaerae bacterium]
MTGNAPFAERSEFERRVQYEEFLYVHQARVDRREASVMTVSFEVALRYLEERGWRLQRIWKPYRVFVRGKEELPLLVEVQRGQVDRKAWEIIKKHAE